MSEAGYPGYTGPTVTIQDRIDTINRAIKFITTASPEEVEVALDEANINPELQADPGLLIERMRASVADGLTFGPWKAAQRICQAVGLPY
jgi:hypothetical protein